MRYNLTPNELHEVLYNGDFATKKNKALEFVSKSHAKYETKQRLKLAINRINSERQLTRFIANYFLAGENLQVIK